MIKQVATLHQQTKQHILKINSTATNPSTKQFTSYIVTSCLFSWNKVQVAICWTASFLSQMVCCSSNWLFLSCVSRGGKDLDSAVWGNWILWVRLCEDNLTSL